MKRNSPKKGTCTDCKEEKWIEKKYPDPLCGYCNYKRKQEKKKKDNKVTVTKKNKRISPVSQKRLEQLAIYRVRRDKYLREHPVCEVHDCNKATTNLHHKATRRGILLIIVKYFMATCEACHPKRIHENPKWARENGYLITINNTKDLKDDN